MKAILAMRPRDAFIALHRRSAAAVWLSGCALAISLGTVVFLVVDRYGPPWSLEPTTTTVRPSPGVST